MRSIVGIGPQQHQANSSISSHRHLHSIRTFPVPAVTLCAIMAFASPNSTNAMAIMTVAIGPTRKDVVSAAPPPFD